LRDTSGSPYSGFNDLAIGTSIALHCGERKPDMKGRESRPVGAEVVRQSTTVCIRVQYDSNSRTFKLVDQEFKTLLEGDALYDLNVPLMYEEADVEEFIPWSDSLIAHS
jgi:hypothetical protein